MEKINFEEITLRSQISSRGGGIEISLDSLGYDGGKMTAYQNYLGGGILGRVCSDCNIAMDEKLEEIAEQLRQYFHTLTNPEEGSWEHFSFDRNQKLPESAY